jgi:Kae1-associated kinase Bud32
MIILFDLDGTMIDDRKNIIECFKETQRAFGLKEWSSREITEMIGLPLEKVFSAIAPFGEEMKTFYEKRYATKRRDKTLLIPGIERALSFLKGFKVGVVTSRSNRTAKALLSDLGLTLDPVVGSDGIKTKPSGEPIRKAMALAGESSAVYIGDTQIDAKSAENAGVDFIGVSWGIDGKNLRCSRLAESADELISLIKETLGLRKTIKQGAEAKLYEDTFLGRRCVVKERSSKGYREKNFDRALRAHRTREEAKLIHEARICGVNVPRIYDVTEDSIVMEFIEGRRAKEVFEERDDKELCTEIGRAAGRLHSNDIIHGDITTSNIILHENRVYFIDFGLGEKSSEIEKKGVDLHVLAEALKAVGKENLFDYVMEGYRSTYDEAEEVIKRIEEISKRGRYAD